MVLLARRLFLTLADVLLRIPGSPCLLYTGSFRQLGVQLVGFLAVATYAAVFMVLWLAVKKINKPVILAFAFVIRLFIVLPDIMNRFKVIENVWISELISVVILVIVWMAALYCRKSFIDSEDAEEN